ncbi:MAG: hypothetical protein CM1200mP9_10800 [Gammaproteobacteria bacterium]|nr:MAG: hypothetical protein CM1200mP9_10800 [Gammaproteobacteria bacterium]
MLPGIITGDVQLTLAHAEEQARFDLDDVVTTAREDGEHHVLNGKKSMVPNAATATHIIVSARTGGGQQDKTGIALFLIDADDLDGNHFPTVDGGRASEISLDNVRVPTDRMIGDYEIFGEDRPGRGSCLVRGSAGLHGGVVQEHGGVHPRARAV